jgi:DNA-binding GntR family transcriptional regulator
VHNPARVASQSPIDSVLPESGFQPSGPDQRVAPGVSNEARVVHAIADAIFEHRLPPGTKLAEADLCRIFGVSRGVVRKALNRLGSEKLLELVPNRGAFVARPTVEHTRDVYEVRRILESGVVRCLARKCPHAAPAPRPWLDALRKQIGEEREANRTGDTSRYIRLAGQFHLDLAAVTGNEELVAQLKRVIAQTSLMIALYDVPGTNACSFHEHLEILAAIESGDYGSAERLMDEHLVTIERQLRLGGEPQSIDLDRVFAAANNAPSQ